MRWLVAAVKVLRLLDFLRSILMLVYYLYCI
jgi:hypothetical protein